MGSINRFRALNNRFARSIKNLKNEVDCLQETSEKLKVELHEFDGIRVDMEEYAKKHGMKFDDIFKKITGIFDTMNDVQIVEDRTVLLKIAADVEFQVDRRTGMNKDEFHRFCRQVPERFKQ